MPRLLTDRQADVLTQLCGGASENQIANVLGIPAPEVADLLAQIYARLGTADPVDLCALASGDVAGSVDRMHPPPPS
jgi:DNA-binding NarL/FixJ family response regulator